MPRHGCPQPSQPCAGRGSLGWGTGTPVWNSAAVGVEVCYRPGERGSFAKTQGRCSFFCLHTWKLVAPVQRRDHFWSDIRSNTVLWSLGTSPCPWLPTLLTGHLASSQAPKERSSPEVSGPKAGGPASHLLLKYPPKISGKFLFLFGICICRVRTDSACS